jgi:hypothetical protein
MSRDDAQMAHKWRIVAHSCASGAPDVALTDRLTCERDAPGRVTGEADAAPGKGRSPI